MRRLILRSTAFERAARGLTKRNHAVARQVVDAVRLLAEDAFDSRLKTHKLSGVLDGLWACSVSHDLRMVFRFVDHGGQAAILLQSVGSHDEVY